VDWSDDNSIFDDLKRLLLCNATVHETAMETFSPLAPD